MRMRTAKVVRVKDNVLMVIMMVLRFAGFLKLGWTPAGGVAVGPFKSASSAL